MLACDGASAARRSRGAMLIADTVNELAARLRLPADIFAEKWRDVEILKTRGGVDRYGRRFSAEQELRRSKIGCDLAADATTATSDQPQPY